MAELLAGARGGCIFIRTKDICGEDNAPCSREVGRILRGMGEVVWRKRGSVKGVLLETRPLAYLVALALGLTEIQRASRRGRR